MIIWLASYPKSGNTWVRSIISSLVYTEDGIFDFPSIKKISQYPQRRFLEYFTQDYNNIHEIKKHWITSQERINLDSKIKFFNKGPNNNWQNTLSKDIQRELETELKNELRELGYL